MLKVGIVGVGNAGSQVAALAKEKLGIDAMAINSSEKDLRTVPDSVVKILIGDQKGAGKERAAAKIFLKESIMEIIKNDDAKKVFDQEVLFIVSSTGGGTGSGTSLVLTNIIAEICPSTKVITVGILPQIKDAMSTQLNSLEYLKELYATLDRATYMLYDNEKFSDRPTTQAMIRVNESIVNDIDVIRGTFQTVTPFSSIDEKDMLNLIGTSGRIVIASLRDVKEKDVDTVSLESLLVNELKKNAHAEIQRDKIVNRVGVIVNLSDRLSDIFDTRVPEVQNFIGSPVEEFEHISVNNDRHLPNNIFLILTGLTQINDRIRKINDRIDEINEAQKQREDESELNSLDMDELSSKIERRKNGDSADSVDLKSIFGKFGV